MPLKFNLPGGVSVYREVSPAASPKPAKKTAPVVQPSPEPKKTLLETAVEAVDEVVRPKAKRGRKPKASAE